MFFEGRSSGLPFLSLYDNRGSTSMYRYLLPALLLCSLCLAATKKPQLPQKYKTWLQQDVLYIITDEEKKSFQSLDNDAARDQFIETFWDIRNPNRGSK